MVIIFPAFVCINDFATTRTKKAEHVISNNFFASFPDVFVFVQLQDLMTVQICCLNIANTLSSFFTFLCFCVIKKKKKEIFSLFLLILFTLVFF